MENLPRFPRIPLRASLVIGAILLVIWLVSPSFDGYHIGYNSSTDNACLSRLVQWCGHRDFPAYTSTGGAALGVNPQGNLTTTSP